MTTKSRVRGRKMTELTWISGGVLGVEYHFAGLPGATRVGWAWKYEDGTWGCFTLGQADVVRNLADLDTAKENVRQEANSLGLLPL